MNDAGTTSSLGGQTGGTGSPGTGGVDGVAGETGAGGLVIPEGCGDGIHIWPALESTVPTEYCDDGNRVPSDGCEPDCRLTPNPYVPLPDLTYSGDLSTDDEEFGFSLDADRDLLLVGALPGGSSVTNTSIEEEYQRLSVYRFETDAVSGSRYVPIDIIPAARVPNLQSSSDGVSAKLSDEEIAWHPFNYEYGVGDWRVGTMLFRWDGETFAPRYHVTAPPVDLCPQSATLGCDPYAMTDVALDHGRLAFSAANAHIVIEAPDPNPGTYRQAGRVFVYDVTGDTPVLEASLSALDEVTFGQSVSLFEDVLAVSGSDFIHTCRKIGESWESEATLPCARGAVELARNLVVTNSECDVSSNTYGQLNLYRHDADGWSFDTTLLPPDPTWAGKFGRSFDVSGDRIVVGAQGK